MAKHADRWETSMTQHEGCEAVRTARGTSGQSPEEGLARDLSELAREMQNDQSMEALLDRIAAAAVREVAGAEHASISEIAGRNVHTRAGTDPLVERIDQAQYRLSEGPCLAALREQMTVRSDDLDDEQRWPRFAKAAVDEGVRSMLSVQLFVQGDNLGALNLYASEPKSFSDADESTAMMLAAHAAVAMKGARMESNFRVALESRDVIGQAKGILMERYKIDATEAFDLLVMASQRTHKKLRDVAYELSTTGELRIDNA